MKILILSGKALHVSHLKLLDYILHDHSLEIAVALIDNRPPLSLMKKFKKNLRRGRGGYMFIMLFNRLMSKTRTCTDVNANEYFSSVGIPCLETTQPYDEQIISRLLPYNVDIAILLGGFGIVKEPLLSLAPGGILSYHFGNMRKYRGQPPGFWELYNNEKDMGVTVQKLSAGLDCGTPIVEKNIQISKEDTQNSLRDKAFDLSPKMMYEALLLVQTPDFSPAIIQKFGKVYTLPNFRQYLLYKIKLLIRRVAKQ